MVSLSDPLSLYAIPAMWVISIYPAMARSAIMTRRKAFNAVAPRGNVANISEKKSIDPALAARITRMDGAHYNGLENLPFFGLSVLAGNIAGLDNQTMNVASGLYLACRLTYNYIYFNQTSPTQANLRTLTWLTSMSFPFYLFIKSAQKLSEK